MVSHMENCDFFDNIKRFWEMRDFSNESQSTLSNLSAALVENPYLLVYGFYTRSSFDCSSYEDWNRVIDLEREDLTYASMSYFYAFFLIIINGFLIIHNILNKPNFKLDNQLEGEGERLARREGEKNPDKFYYYLFFITVSIGNFLTTILVFITWRGLPYIYISTPCSNNMSHCFYELDQSKYQQDAVIAIWILLESARRFPQLSSLLTLTKLNR